MKKIGIMAVLAAGLWVSTTAQVKEDKTTILGTEHVCLRIDMNHDAKLLSTALEDKLDEAGVKTKSSKGLITATGVQLTEITPDVMDYYFRVGAVDKKQSVLYLSISKGYANFINPANNPQVWENGKLFLNNMLAVAARHQMQEKAKELEKEVKSAEKDHKKAARKFEKQEKKLNDYRKEMEAAQAEWNAKKAELETLQYKIKR